MELHIGDMVELQLPDGQVVKARVEGLSARFPGKDWAGTSWRPAAPTVDTAWSKFKQTEFNPVTQPPVSLKLDPRAEPIVNNDVFAKLTQQELERQRREVHKAVNGINFDNGHFRGLTFGGTPRRMSRATNQYTDGNGALYFQMTVRDTQYLATEANKPNRSTALALWRLAGEFLACLSELKNIPDMVDSLPETAGYQERLLDHIMSNLLTTLAAVALDLAAPEASVKTRFAIGQFFDSLSLAGWLGPKPEARQATDESWLERAAHNSPMTAPAYQLYQLAQRCHAVWNNAFSQESEYLARIHGDDFYSARLDYYRQALLKEIEQAKLFKRNPEQVNED